MNDIVSYVLTNLTCPICYELAYFNVECNLCNRIFCTHCIQHTQKNFPEEAFFKCPHCRQESDFYENKLAYNILLQIIVNCDYCKKEMTREDLPEHLDKCVGKIVKCLSCLQNDRLNIHKCKYKYCKLCKEFYIDKKNHELTCQKRICKCEFCDSEYELENKFEHIYTVCQVYPIKCQFCDEYLRKKDLINHYILCDKFEMKCKLCNKIYLKKIGHRCYYEVCLLCKKVYHRHNRQYHEEMECDIEEMD